MHAQIDIHIHGHRETRQVGIGRVVSYFEVTLLVRIEKYVMLGVSLLFAGQPFLCFKRYPFLFCPRDEEFPLGSNV